MTTAYPILVRVLLLVAFLVGAGGVEEQEFLVSSLFSDNVLHYSADGTYLGVFASGISLYRIDGGPPSTGNLVLNNTVIVAADGRWALNIQDGSSGNTIANNILYSHHSFRGSISIDAAALAGFVSDSNRWSAAQP